MNTKNEPDAANNKEAAQGVKQDALAEISSQLEVLKQKNAEKPRRNVSGSLLSLAYRLTIEMFAAIAVCGYLGWWIDQHFDTKPIFLLVLLILGVIAGLMNAVRTAASMRSTGEPLDRDENVPAKVKPTNFEQE